MIAWHGLLRWRQGLGRHWCGLLLVLLVVAGVLVDVPHLKGWHHHRAGQSAMNHYKASSAW